MSKLYPLAALAAGAALVVIAPLAASAHVTVDASQVAPGSYSLMTFKVPNESDTAGTNRVELSLPTDTPFASVSYVPVPGWSAELVRSTLPEPVKVGDGEITEAVTSVIWTADDGTDISDGELQLFPLSVGPVPDVGSVILPVDQGYTDGSTVSWDETGDDAEKPAPVLYVNDEPAEGHHGGDDENEAGGHDGGDDQAASVSTRPTSSTDGGADVLARILGVGGLAVGVVGVVLAIGMRRSPAK